MKHFFSVVLTLVFFTPVFSQRTLSQLLRADHGVSRQLVVLPDSQKLAFNPAKAQSALGLDAASDLVITQTETDKLGIIHYRYAQTYKGIPIENAMFIAHTRSGLLTAAGGNIITDFSLQQQTGQTSIQAGFTPQQAVDAALQYVHAEQYAWQDADYEQGLKTWQGANATYYPTAVKVWYSGEEQVDPARLKLAYRVDVYSLKPFDRKFIYIDAQNGKVLGEKARMLPSDAAGTVATVYSGAQPVHIDYAGTQYRLRDYTKGKGIVTLNAAAKDSDYVSTSSNWASITGMDRYALDAHYGVSATWTFYFNNFNRNSVDNNGYQLVSHVNDPAVAAGNNGNPANAYWDGYSMHYGYLTNGSGLTAIDITGHELTHGVTQYSSQLTYSGESGAINESMSDIMGKSVQFYTKPGDVNWQISNDIPWFIRDMSNPNARSQPDTYGGSYWVTTAGCNPTSRNDYCGVHTNSGVGNYMFYLLVTGGSGKNDIGNSFAVAGIGLSKADQILYRTNTVYLGPTAKYADWRAACIQAATDLYGASSNEAAQVMNAWYAVGVGAAAATCNPPTGLTAANVTSTEANLTWTAAAGVQSYTLQWKAAGAAGWTTVTGINTAAYNLTGLVPGTAYTFQVATVCSSGTSGYSTPANFTTAAASTANGLTYKYYEGTWTSLPNFSTLTPAATGSSANADIGVRPAGRNDNFAFVWEGYIVITTPGTYTFETVSDDGSRLYFNSLYNAAATPTVNNDGVHAPVSATGTVDILAAGTYPISITFFEKDGGEQMQVYWTGPNFARQPIPNSAFTQTPPASVNGLSYKYYEGTWTSLPDFSTLTPVKTGTSANTDISARTPGHDDNFGFVWQGYINITTPGTYTFETVSDDGSRLYFNQLYDAAAYPTVNNDGVHPPASATGTVYIAVAGVYPISVTFFEKDGGEQMQVYWTGPNFARQLIPNTAFTQAPPAAATPLTYKYYEGVWNNLPNFNALAPVKTGISASTDISVRTSGRNDNFAFVWQGYINLLRPGSYTFETVSDDGSKLYFNLPYDSAATATVNNDGLHAPVSATGTVNVAVAGVYPISVTFFEKDGGEQMEVYWTGPNFARQPIPAQAFSVYRSTSSQADAPGDTAIGIVSSSLAGNLNSKVQVGKIYPNPFTESVRIDFYNSATANSISAGIYDVNGRLVYQHPAHTFAPGNNTLQMDVSGKRLANGLYFIKLAVNGSTIKTVKLVKAK